MQVHLRAMLMTLLMNTRGSIFDITEIACTTISGFYPFYVIMVYM